MDDFCRQLPLKFTGSPRIHMPLSMKWQLVYISLIFFLFRLYLLCFILWTVLPCWYCCCVITMWNIVPYTKFFMKPHNEYFAVCVCEFVFTRPIIKMVDRETERAKRTFSPSFQLSCFVEIGDNLVKLNPLFCSLTARWYGKWNRTGSATTFFLLY